MKRRPFLSKLGTNKCKGLEVAIQIWLNSIRMNLNDFLGFSNLKACVCMVLIAFITATTTMVCYYYSLYTTSVVLRTKP